jgi:hypothetical protein
MSDKQVKVAKPEKTKPNPVKPETTKPESVKPVKAHVNAHCVRCSCAMTTDIGRVRALCSGCDLELQVMHHSVEWTLFDRTVYMSEKGEAQWFKDNYGRVLTKPPAPVKRGHNVVALSP